MFKTYTLLQEGIFKSIVQVTYFDTQEIITLLLDNEVIQEWNQLGIL